jgi:CheY-like chemotaxis protein
VLVIDREAVPSPLAPLPLATETEVVRARTMARAMGLLREQPFDGVFVPAALFPEVRWAANLIQAEEVLESILDGVAVVEPSRHRILWHNKQFGLMVQDGAMATDLPFRQALGLAEPAPGEDCVLRVAESTRKPTDEVIRVGPKFFHLSVCPTLDATGEVLNLVAVARDVTLETQQEQKLAAIHKAGEELADLTPEELSRMDPTERSDLLKYNILQHMRDLFGLDYIEIRVLDAETGRLTPLLTEGMTKRAASRELYASSEGNGVTGFVAATGKSYLCPDTTLDPRYLEGAAGARSSLTVPLVYAGKPIGTLNVENPNPGAFDERDQRFLEIYGRNIASALNTLELLEAEKVSTAAASVDAIIRELALPLDDILSDATTVLDRYAGHDEDIVGRLRHLLARAREIRGLVKDAGAAVVPATIAEVATPPKLGNARILVVDADQAIRQAAHLLLGRLGATVETARDAQEAIAFVRTTTYSVALVDIRLPDLDGYQAFKRLREAQPGIPVILMTGFGYDPTHSIVNARKEGLNTVLYKPFRVDRLTEAVEQAIRSTPVAGGSPPPAAPNQAPAAS